MSHDDNSLDFNKLQRELDAAVAMDAKYWRENDAKIRAVTEQKVATYDEFKDLVAASHLKPLDKGMHLDNIGGHTKQPWNAAAAQNKQKSEGPTTQAQQTQAQGEMKVPNSGQEFAREWQRTYKTAEQRYAYIINTGAPQLKHIFKTEVSFGLLGEILAALSTFPAEDTAAVLGILDSLQASSRFSLSLQFLSKKEKDICEQLFVKLSQTVQDQNLMDLQERLSNLKLCYLPS